MSRVIGVSPFIISTFEGELPQPPFIMCDGCGTLLAIPEDRPEWDREGKPPPRWTGKRMYASPDGTLTWREDFCLECSFAQL